MTLPWSKTIILKGKWIFIRNFTMTIFLKQLALIMLDYLKALLHYELFHWRFFIFPLVFYFSLRFYTNMLVSKREEDREENARNIYITLCVG